MENYILFVKKLIDVDKIIDGMLRTSSFNPHANVLVIINNNLADDEWEPLVKSFFKSFWIHFIIHVSILFPNFNRSINTVIFFFIS